jgi:hypothetical protein
MAEKGQHHGLSLTLRSSVIIGIRSLARKTRKLKRIRSMRTVTEMAREVYGEHTFWTGPQLERLEQFAELVRADEREACAQFIEHEYVRQFERPWRVDLSAAIRARGLASIRSNT